MSSIISSLLAIPGLGFTVLGFAALAVAVALAQLGHAGTPDRAD